MNLESLVGFWDKFYCPRKWSNLRTLRLLASKVLDAPEYRALESLWRADLYCRFYRVAW